MEKIIDITVMAADQPGRLASAKQRGSTWSLNKRKRCIYAPTAAAKNLVFPDFTAFAGFTEFNASSLLLENLKHFNTRD